MKVVSQPHRPHREMTEQHGDENLSATYCVFTWTIHSKNSRWWNDTHHFLENLECISSKHNICNDSTKSYRWRVCAGVINPVLRGPKPGRRWHTPGIPGSFVKVVVCLVAQKAHLEFGPLGTGVMTPAVWNVGIMLESGSCIKKKHPAFQNNINGNAIKEQCRWRGELNPHL